MELLFYRIITTTITTIIITTTMEDGGRGLSTEEVKRMSFKNHVKKETLF